MEDQKKLDELIGAWNSDNSYTPDIQKLVRENTHVGLFVYDTLRYRYSDHWRLQNWPRIGLGATAGFHYRMYITAEDQAVVLSVNPTTNPVGRIFGELYSIPVSLLVEIDNYMSNTVFMHRQRSTIRWIEKNGGETKWHFTPCFMYLGDPHHWANHLEQGNLNPKPLTVPEREPDKPYFIFTPEDDAPNRKVQEIANQWVREQAMHPGAM